MLGFKRSNDTESEKPASSRNDDIAKLFFDTFSERLGSFEKTLRSLIVDVETLKVSGDQLKLSDLVLLERLQRSEKILGESLNWIKQIAEAMLRSPTVTSNNVLGGAVGKFSVQGPVVESQPISVSQIPRDPSVVLPGSLTSITTPTELQVLTLLANEGPKSAPEIGRFVGRSREHTARLMKKLFDEGYVRRDQTRIPFRYSTVERVKSGLTTHAQKDQAQEVASVPQA